MKSFEALEKALKKELELSEKHKQNAADIRKEIEMQRGKTLSKKINSLNLSGQEYDKFLLLLDRKKSVLEAVDVILGEKDTDGEQDSVPGAQAVETEDRMEDPEREKWEEERGKQEVEI